MNEPYLTLEEQILFKHSESVLGPLDTKDWTETFKEDSEEGRYMRGIILAMKEYAVIQVRASERLRMEDASSAISEANALRDRLKELEEQLRIERTTGRQEWERLQFTELERLKSENYKHVKTLKLLQTALVKAEQIEDIEVMVDAIEELAQTITVVLDACTKQSVSCKPIEAYKTE